MAHDTNKILESLINSISSIKHVQSIGMSGNKTPLPKAGEGDIDIFIYCDVIPQSEQRQAVLIGLGDLLEEVRINIFQEEHWGTGDLVLINGVETWLMYFTVEATLNNIESILKGEYPDKLDNYYYPIGRCAMLKDINILYDKNDFLVSLKEKLTEYPVKLAEKLIRYHIGELKDVEDLERAVIRKDVLFYHFAMDLAIDHYLQALFALNKSFFPSRKRSLQFIDNFNIKPEGCGEKLLEVIRLGAFSESIKQSYELWSDIVNQLINIFNMQSKEENNDYSFS